MTTQPWELVLAQLGEKVWDEATELASMLADEHFPTILDHDFVLTVAAEIVVKIGTDEDYQRCIRPLLDPDYVTGRGMEPCCDEDGLHVH